MLSNRTEPKNNLFLLGQEEAEAALLQAWQNGCLHNSFIFEGAEGIGKATLAYKFVRFLLEADESKKEQYKSLDTAPNSASARLIAGNSHPNVRIIERDYIKTDKEKIIKALKSGNALAEEDLSELKKSAEIKVDEVRTINEFFTKSADGWRIVIVDSIDELNKEGANAILKILEEPPAKSLIILISHNPMKLLPTIKSRCAKLRLKPLPDNIVASLLRRYAPEIAEDKVQKIAQMANGSIGKALDFAEFDFAGKYDALCQIVYAKDKFKLANLLSFAADAVSDENSFSLTQDLILKFITLQDAQDDRWAVCWSDTCKIFEDTVKLNLDKKQTVIRAVNNLIKVICQ